MVKPTDGNPRRSPRKLSIKKPLPMKGKGGKSSDRVAMRAKAYTESGTSERSSNNQRSSGNKMMGTRQTGNVRKIIVGKKDQYRSSLIAFLKVLPELKNNGFGDKHEELLKKTPFWKLYGAYNDGLVTEALYSKSDKVLMKLIRCFDKEEKAFRIGGRLIEFTPLHVSQMLGLPNDGIQLKLHTKEGMKADYGKRYFAGLRQLDLTHVKHALKLAVRGTSEENISDTVRLICLFLCTTLLFANTGNSIAWFIHNWMDDLDKMSAYNWSQVMHEWLIDDMIKKEERPSSVTGCAIVLLFWISEVTTLIEPIEDRQNMEPGFLKWNISQLTPLLQNADFSELEIHDVNPGQNGAQEPAHTEDPLETPDTRSSDNRGKKGARTKKRSSRHKKNKTLRFTLPETQEKASRTNVSTSDYEGKEGLPSAGLGGQESINERPDEDPSECVVRDDQMADLTNEKSPLKASPDKSNVDQDTKTHSKKRRRLRQRHSSSPPRDNKPDYTMDDCLDDFGMDCSQTAKDAELNKALNYEDELPPRDASVEDLGNVSQDTEPTVIHSKDPHDSENSNRENTMLNQECGDNHAECIDNVQLDQAIQTMNMAPGGTPTTGVHGDSISGLDIQATTLPTVYGSVDVLQDTNNEEEPKTPSDSDSDGLNGDDVTE